MEVLFGLHPVSEAVRSRPKDVDHVSVSRERRDARLEALIQTCRAAGVRVTTEPKAQLDRLSQGEMHQGAVAFLRERSYLDIEDLLNRQRTDGTRRFFLALDGVEDPHNLGALLRTADGAGVDGVLIPERRAAGISAIVARASAGASEHVRIARVTNLVRALERMKQENIWVIGLDERGSADYSDFDFTQTDCVLVLGREGAGLHDLVKKTCDHLLRIPMAGRIASLNVSVAGAVVLYEAMRQKRTPTVAAPVAAKPKKPQRGLGS